MDHGFEETDRDGGPVPFPAPAVEPEERQRKRRKTTTHGGGINPSFPPPSPPPYSRWKTGWERQMFSSKLLSALRDVGAPDAAAATLPRSCAVRDAADRILAAAAGGRSRWSRAMLRRHRAASRKARSRRTANPVAHGLSPAALLERKQQAGSEGRGANIDMLRGKAKVLGRIVPGCRKASLPRLLEETSDYIAALEMQVRAMSALAEMLTCIGGSSSVVGSSYPSFAAGPSRH